MPPALSPVGAVHSLISAFGESFAPGDSAPLYEASLDGPRIRLTTSRGVIEEHASEWKRLCGRLWVQALPDERARALEVLLPTLSDFDGAVWAPMQRLLEGRRCWAFIACSCSTWCPCVARAWGSGARAPWA